MATMDGNQRLVTSVASQAYLPYRSYCDWNDERLSERWTLDMIGGIRIKNSLVLVISHPQ